MVAGAGAGAKPSRATVARECYRSAVHVDAVIVAAGRSTRFGSRDKLLADLCGLPVLAWSIAAMAAAETVTRIFVVAREDALAEVEAQTAAAGGETPVVFLPGGERRRDSVGAGVCAASTEYVAIHDGARPLVRPEQVDACVEAAKGRPGAILAVPVTDTIKDVQDGVITGSPDRARLWAAQTPQVVRREAWLEAAAQGAGDETDDAAMLARLDLEVAVVEGDSENIKVTRPFDLGVARIFLGRRVEA